VSLGAGDIDRLLVLDHHSLLLDGSIPLCNSLLLVVRHVGNCMVSLVLCMVCLCLVL